MKIALEAISKTLEDPNSTPSLREAAYDAAAAIADHVLRHPVGEHTDS